MKNVNNEGNKHFERVQNETPMHNTPPVPNNYHTEISTFMILSME